ncbi:MAG: SDR family NAD(P)-dependent oxidoreductase [Polyangiaceae bacterium]|jgi:short-subunit dehydrogenase
MALTRTPRCVITGAGSGFGRAMAIELAGRHAHLVLSDIDLSALEATVDATRAAGASSARGLRCDVTRLDEVEHLARESPGDLDLVVNNAGVASAGRIGELPLDVWRWTLEADLFGVIHGCHVFVPRMRERGRGHVLNVASAAGILSMPGMGAYNVAKAGVIALSETLDGELRGTGVGVTVLCPSFFRTNIAKNGRFTDPWSRAEAERLVSHGKPVEDIARAALAAVERGEFYAIPMADARWLWRLKRLAPNPFRAIVARQAGRRRKG